MQYQRDVQSASGKGMSEQDANNPLLSCVPPPLEQVQQASKFKAGS
jgi:hypothetical protein